MKRIKTTLNLAAVAASALVLTPANAWAAAVIYEPFAQTPGNLPGQAAGSTGLSGNWTKTGSWSNPTVVSGSMSYGSLATSGNSASGTDGTGGDRGFASASLGGSLSTAGLLDDGDELWFSVLWEATSNVNRTGHLMLVSEPGSYLQATSFRPNSGSDSNTTIDAFGFFIGGGGDNLQGRAVANGVVTTGSQGANMTLNTTHLIVGKITWGAATDTLDLYLPGTDLALPGSTYLSQSFNIDQSGLDHLSLGGNGQVLNMDEIRFGATYNDVIGADTSGDTTPPTPAQMSWASPPAAISDSAITMTAVEASDENGVQYSFVCTTGGGNDSGWQDSRVYTDTGLSPGQSYTYTVTARDQSANNNENLASAGASATTNAPDTNPPPVPTFITPLGPVTTAEITVSANPVVDGEGSGVEYRFHNTTLATDSGWLASPTWTDSGLDPETTYSYTVQARDTSAGQNESAASTPESATTLADVGAGGAVIYEPFAQTPGNLPGQAAGSTGLSGNWTKTGDWSNPTVVLGGMSYGSLATSGNSASGTDGTGGDRGFASASLGGSLSTAGLLDDGDELWFSVLWEATSNANRTGHLMLVSEPGSYLQATSFRPNSGSDSNTTIDAFGFFIGGGGDNLQGRAVANGVVTTGSQGANMTLNTIHLIVGKITWGAATDTLDLYLPGTDLALPGSTYLSQSFNIDQSGLDHLSLGGNGQVLNMDEIRFGATYEDAIGMGGPAATIRLTITPNEPTTRFQLAWASQSGMLYNVRSSADLSAELSTWTLVQGDIPASGTGETTWDVDPTETILFYRVEEFQPTPLALETFEGGAIPAGWNAVVNTGSGTAWEVGDPSTFSGGVDSLAPPTGAGGSTNCYGTNLLADYGALADVSLVTPPISIPAGGATLRLEQWLDTESPSGGGDYGTIKVRDAGTNADLGNLNPANLEGIGSSGWIAQTYSLAPYVGQSIKIEFLFTSDNDADVDYAGWYLDNVEVTAD